MSTSVVLCDNLGFFAGNVDRSLVYSCHLSDSFHQLNCRRRKFCGLVPEAKRRHHKKKKSWWQKFFFDEEGNWLGLKDEDMIDAVESESQDSSGEELTENEKFEAWRRRAEAIIELREAQEDMMNEENRMWEDWIVEENKDVDNGSSWIYSSNGVVGKSESDTTEDPTDMIPGRGLVESMRDMVLGKEEDDLLYEDRVFRYVKKVPLAAKMLDVRRYQKLEMVKELKLEKARYRLEVEIGKSPPLSDEELWLELRDKALELRDERRLENRSSFANIWSDMVYGISLFILLYFNQSKVALLKFTGYKIINNISDTGKAFLIILITDIFLGYHSESGWQTLCEVIVEHYGLEVDQTVITIFICLVPVIMDACVKLWLFKFLPRLSPRVSNIFREMKRH